MGPHTKLYMYLKHYVIFLWLCVTMYLMCSPRQLFFQCGPEMPKRWKPLRQSFYLFTEMFIGVFENYRNLISVLHYWLMNFLTTVTLWKSEIVWRWLFRNEIQKLQVLYTLHLLTLRYITYKSIIGHFLSIPTPHPHIPLGTKLQCILSYLFILSA